MNNYKQHFLESDIQGLEQYSEHELKKHIIDQIYDRLDSAGVSDKDVSIKAIALCGSRNRNTAKDDSDLDVVMEYSGSMREDDVFNILHDEEFENGKMMIDNIEIDVNPIRPQQSGDIKSFLKKSKEYDNYVLSNVGETLTEKKKKQKKHKRQHFRRWFGYYPWWPIRPMPPPPKPPAPPPPGPPPPGPGPEPGPEPGPSGGDIGGAVSGGDAGGAAAGPVGEATTNKYTNVDKLEIKAIQELPEKEILKQIYDVFKDQIDEITKNGLADMILDSIAYDFVRGIYYLKFLIHNKDNHADIYRYAPMIYDTYNGNKFIIASPKNRKILKRGELQQYKNTYFTLVRKNSNKGIQIFADKLSRR